MSVHVKAAVPIIPAVDVAASLAWWIDVCGFTESFRHGSPATYAGVHRDGASLHLAAITDGQVARIVGEQTMLRILVDDAKAMYEEYLGRGGAVHPNGGLTIKPWGSTEFATIDPAGVCVYFAS